MAGKRRHWKEKNGRFWARIAVPKNLQSILGKSELIEPLGGDLRIADRNHAGAVARLQAQITKAANIKESDKLIAQPFPIGRDITQADYQHAAWAHYNSVIEADEQKRADMPTPEEIEAEYECIMQKIEAGEADVARIGVGVFNLYTDFELKAGARHFDANLRTRRLHAFQKSLASGDTHFVDTAVQKYVDDNQLSAPKGSSAWRTLANHIIRAEIEALKTTIRRDSGDFSSHPLDSILKPPISSQPPLPPLPLKQLFKDYIVNRQSMGTHRDGGAIWEYPIDALIKFLGHDDARKITAQNILDWRESYAQKLVTALVRRRLEVA